MFIYIKWLESITVCPNDDYYQPSIQSRVKLGIKTNIRNEDSQAGVVPLIYDEVTRISTVENHCHL